MANKFDSNKELFVNYGQGGAGVQSRGVQISKSEKNGGYIP